MVVVGTMLLSQYAKTTFFYVDLRRIMIQKPCLFLVLDLVTAHPANHTAMECSSQIKFSDSWRYVDFATVTVGKLR